MSENERLCKAQSFETCTQDILKRFWIQTAWMATGMAAGVLQDAVRDFNEKVHDKKNIQAKLERCVGIV